MIKNFFITALFILFSVSTYAGHNCCNETENKSQITAEHHKSEHNHSKDSTQNHSDNHNCEKENCNCYSCQNCSTTTATINKINLSDLKITKSYKKYYFYSIKEYLVKNIHRPPIHSSFS